MSTFVVLKDSKGKAHIADAVFFREVLKEQCPQCKKENEPYWFDYYDERTDGGRKYYYCCPDCFGHYFSGEKDFWDSCETGGDHSEDIDAMEYFQKLFWRSQGKVRDMRKTQSESETDEELANRALRETEKELEEERSMRQKNQNKG
jgi:hypothetical protein